MCSQLTTLIMGLQEKDEDSATLNILSAFYSCIGYTPGIDGKEAQTWDRWEGGTVVVEKGKTCFKWKNPYVKQFFSYFSVFVGSQDPRILERRMDRGLGAEYSKLPLLVGVILNHMKL